MDSLNESIAGKFNDRIFKDEDQDTNDLTKAVAWCQKEVIRIWLSLVQPVNGKTTLLAIFRFLLNMIKREGQ